MGRQPCVLADEAQRGYNTGRVTGFSTVARAAFGPGPTGATFMKCKRISVLVLVLLAAGGCAKSDDSGNRAERAVGGLMPGATPQYEAAYVVDPSQAKLLPARTISYEPLETFRGSKQALSAEEPGDENSEGEKTKASDQGKEKESKKVVKTEKKSGETGGKTNKPGDNTKAAAKDGTEKTPAKPNEKNKKTPSAEKSKEAKKSDTSKPAEEAKEQGGEEQAAESGEQPAAEEGQAEGGDEQGNGDQGSGEEGGEGHEPGGDGKAGGGGGG